MSTTGSLRVAIALQWGTSPLQVSEKIDHETSLERFFRPSTETNIGSFDGIERFRGLVRKREDSRIPSKILHATLPLDADAKIGDVIRDVRLQEAVMSIRVIGSMINTQRGGEDDGPLVVSGARNLFLSRHSSGVEQVDARFLHGRWYVLAIPYNLEQICGAGSRLILPVY